MHPGPLARSKESNIEITVTVIPHGITDDNKRGRGGRLGSIETLLDGEHWSGHFADSLRSTLLNSLHTRGA